MGRAIPRTWMASGKSVGIERAPTRWGKVSFRLQSTGSNVIEGELTLPDGSSPKDTWLSLRVPAGKRLIEVHLDGVASDAAEHRDAAIRICGKPGQRIEVRARFV